MYVDINYLAVLVAAIASMAVGFVWYGVLFRNSWMSLMGYTPESMRGMKMTANKAYAIQFIASLVLAYVLSGFVDTSGVAAGVVNAGSGIATGFWAWLGFIAPVTLGVVLWENKPWKLWFINASHYLAMLLVMGAIIGAWS